MNFARRVLCSLSLPMLVSCASLGTSGTPASQLDRLEVVSRGPAFGGAVFEGVGQYETIVAVAHLRIDPRHPANRIIVDLDKTPADGGWVRYKTDVVIVRPRDAAKASRVLLLELPNRGAKMVQRMVNEGAFDIDSPNQAGNGYTMRRGHTLAWVGWQGDVALSANGKLAGTAFPIASVDGKPITGQSMAESVFDDLKPVSTMMLAYPAASADQSKAVLTVRATATAAPTILAASTWRYTSPSAIELQRPAGFDGGAIYQFQYEARDARVMGLGMAATRDVTAFLKSGAPDGAGQPNPLADIRPATTVALGFSQSGRFLRDLVWQGFNDDTRGGRVFDGALPVIAGSRKSFVNARFAQPGRYSTQHLDHTTHGDQFPFSYGVTTDPVGGATDGIFARCERSGTCPKLMHVDSNLEFWQARASLVVTDGLGQDIALPAGVRAYLMSSTQHVAAPMPAVGTCKYMNNPARQAPLLRALIEDMVEWTRDGREPPASRYPRRADNMLTAPQRDAVGFPDLSAIGVAFPGVINELALVDYGTLPARVDATRRYRIFVPMTDQDGHDIAGVRLPDIAVPLATHSGWNLRRAPFAEGQLCGLNGISVPFAATPKAGDPRRAISQRYPDRLEYAKAVAGAARELRDQRLLLQEDVDRYIERAKAERRVGP